MPTLTIDLSDAAIQRLDAYRVEHNAATGEALTLRQWLIHHLREVAISRELGTKATDLQRQAGVDVETAVEAERQRLMGLM